MKEEKGDGSIFPFKWENRTVPFFIFFIFFITVSLPIMSYEVRKGVPLKQGVFLAATPGLTDPNFIHTVILLVKYGKDGAVGLIINRPSGIHLQKVFPNIKDIQRASSSIFIGGPVNRGNLLILFTSDNPPNRVDGEDGVDEAQRVFDNIYLTGSEKIIIPLLESGNPDNKLQAYSGYAGWAPGQLEHEIMRGDWITVEADSSMIFNEDPYRIWPSIFKIPEDIMVRSIIPYLKCEDYKG